VVRDKFYVVSKGLCRDLVDRFGFAILRFIEFEGLGLF